MGGLYVPAMAERSKKLFNPAELAFTVAELLIAVALIAIFFAIAVPHWSILLPTHNLNSALRQVQSELSNIKSLAAATNASHRLSFSATGYAIEKDDGSGWQATGLTRTLPEGIAKASSSASPLGFTSRGTATPGTGGTIKLCDSKNEGANVVVSSTGRIRICKPSSCDGTC